MMSGYLRALFFLVIVSCVNQEKSSHQRLSNGEVNYARSLEINRFDNFTIIKVLKPWQKSDNEEFTYVIADKGVLIPDSLSGFPIIRRPVKTVATFSTTHIGFIAALNKTETIRGISGKDYFYDPLLRDAFNNGLVNDIGYPPAVDYETIIRISPEVVFLYGLGASEAVIVKRLSDAGIPTIMVSEFLENHPLGKAEWIKLFACVYDLSEKGDSIFKTISDNYNSLIPKVLNQPQKPGVLTGLPWKGTWYMAGGNSFTAHLIKDAGGDYIWKDNLSEEFIPLSLEAVFSRAGEADVWINTGTAVSLSDLRSRDNRFENIKAQRTGYVYNNNARLNFAGGNDFWESGTVRPDLILRDLISIFHPGVLDGNELVYYKKLE